MISQRSNYKNYVLKMPKSLKIKNIKSSILTTSEYISTNFVISSEVNEKSTTVCFTRNLYIVNNLKVNMLLDNDILKSKNIFIHVNQKKLTVDNCGDFSTSLKIIVKNDDERIKRTIRSQVEINISIHFCITVSIKYRSGKLFDRNIIFNFNDINRLKKNNVFSHIVDANFFVV